MTASSSSCLPTDLELALPTADASEALGVWLADRLGAGDAVLLSGPIGAGKSTLARALIRARLGRMEDVPSPTFTLVQTYESDGPEIWHADLYRLTHPDEVLELGLADAFETAICLVEWPERLGRLAPPDAIRLTLKDDRADGRTALIHAPGRGDLVEQLAHDFGVTGTTDG